MSLRDELLAHMAEVGGEPATIEPIEMALRLGEINGFCIAIMTADRLGLGDAEGMKQKLLEAQAFLKDAESEIKELRSHLAREASKALELSAMLSARVSDTPEEGDEEAEADADSTG